MEYIELCSSYKQIEHTTKRLEMTEFLVELFKKTPTQIIDKVIYLTQGKLHPDWTGKPEIGMAEKMAIKAVVLATGVSESKINKELKQSGDLGATAEQIIEEKPQQTLLTEKLTVSKVYNTLDQIAAQSGKGTQTIRIRSLAGLLSQTSPLEARYLLRTITGTLRLGIADMTILDALALAFTGDKKNRELLERAYNATSDLGDVSKTLADKGLDQVKTMGIRLKRPVRMMLAQRLSSPDEVLEKFGGAAVCEYKLDGERLQCHKNGDEVTLFSRHLENVSKMYPDIIEAIKSGISANKVIFEGECVAIDAKGKLQPFQLLMRRRRKYNIQEMVQKIPAAIYLFDIIYLNGNDLTARPYVERRRQLQKIIKPGKRLFLTPSMQTSDPKYIDKFFHEALTNGCEGLIIKAPDSIYTWGSRSWRWIKLKESYRSKMIEPVDLVVVGASWGRGRRAGKYGTLLLSCYDKKTDTFPTICKVGSGFSDEDLDNLPNQLEKYRIDKKHTRVDSSLKADIWFVPKAVIEVLGDEITHSPIHTAAFGRLQEESGLAIRFPRFTGRWRYDKGPEDATDVTEIIDMFNRQKS